MKKERFVAGTVLSHDGIIYKSKGLAAVYFKGCQYYFTETTRIGGEAFLEAHPAQWREEGCIRGVAGPSIHIHDNTISKHLMTTVSGDNLYVAWTQWETSKSSVYMKYSSNPQKGGFSEKLEIIASIPSNIRSASLSSLMLPITPEGDPVEWLIFFYTIDADPNNIYVRTRIDKGQWKQGKTYHTPYAHAEWHSIASLPVIGNQGDPAILVAATTSNDGKKGGEWLLRMQTYDGSWHTHLRYISLTHTKHNGDLVMAAGTLVSPSKQDKPMVQIFGMNSGYRHSLRHYEFSIEGKNSDKGWLSAPVDARFPYSKAWPKNVAIAQEFQSTKDGVRQYITVSVRERSSISTATYPSDHYVIAKEKPPIVDTAAHSTQLRPIWSLLGVVEGVPPFTRNGGKDENKPQSMITYGQKVSQAMKVKTGFTFDVAVNFGGASGKVVSSAELSYALSRYQGDTEIKELTFKIPFKNMQKNSDGEYGLLFFAQPSLQNFVYHIKSADKTNDLGSVNQLVVPIITLGYQNYNLSNPEYPGLPKRWPTSNPRAWRDGFKSTSDGIDTENIFFPDRDQGMDFLLAPSTYGVDAKLQFTNTRSNMTTSTHKWSVKLSAELAKLLDFSGSTKSSLSVTNTIETSQTEMVEASVVNMPAPEPNHPHPIEKIVIKPFWLLPNKDPYWIPDEFKTHTPWLLTWRVSSISPDND